MLKIKKPGLGFIAVGLALIFSAVALALFVNTYNVGGYTLSRWALTCSILSIWFLVLLEVNMLFFGDKPFWCGIIYALTAFLLVIAVTQFIQPCLTPIGFVFGAGDLNMGDTALNKVVADKSIITAVFYVLAVICTAVAAFLPAEWTFGKKKSGVKVGD